MEIQKKSSAIPCYRKKWDLSGDIIDCFQRYSGKLSAEEQEEIIKGIEEGLTDQEVKRYFILYGADKMRQYRRVLTARKNRNIKCAEITATKKAERIILFSAFFC